MKISKYLSFGNICHSVDIELDSSSESDVKFAQWACAAFDLKSDKSDDRQQKMTKKDESIFFVISL